VGHLRGLWATPGRVCTATLTLSDEIRLLKARAAASPLRTHRKAEVPIGFKATPIATRSMVARVPAKHCTACVCFDHDHWHLVEPGVQGLQPCAEPAPSQAAVCGPDGPDGQGGPAGPARQRPGLDVMGSLLNIGTILIQARAALNRLELNQCLASYRPLNLTRGRHVQPHLASLKMSRTLIQVCATVAGIEKKRSCSVSNSTFTVFLIVFKLAALLRSSCADLDHRNGALTGD
jgi:hypothetical protein